MISQPLDDYDYNPFDSNSFLGIYDDSKDLVNIANYRDANQWGLDLEIEQEINGDLALIPMPSLVDQNISLEELNFQDVFEPITGENETLSPSEYLKDLGQDYFSSLSELMPPTFGELSQTSNSILHSNEVFDLPAYLNNCDTSEDLTHYVNGAESRTVLISRDLPPDIIDTYTAPNISTNIFNRTEKPGIGIGVKKIDLKAQKYIVDEDEDDVDEDDIDIETISESESSSVSAQFEASEIPQSRATSKNISRTTQNCQNEDSSNKEVASRCRKNTDNLKCPPAKKKLVSIEKHKEIQKKKKPLTKPPNVPKDFTKKNIPQKKNISEARKTQTQTIPETRKTQALPITQNNSTTSFSSEKNKQIGDTPPVELITRIKESGKRRAITLIDPIPNKKRCVARIPENIPQKQNNSETRKTQTQNIFETRKTQTQNIPEMRKTQALPITRDSTTSFSSEKNKQIGDSLPVELITRIKESGKRRAITLIDPIPNKKRSVARIPERTTSQHSLKKPIKPVSTDSIQMDHDYCNIPSPYPKHPMKDSGFTSSEEDDRANIRNQPIVKNNDGKLMVSLLKSNTIRNNTEQKKKLNIQEYKKRRGEDIVKPNNVSKNPSPKTNTDNLTQPEDENLRIQKHVEKMQQMFKEILNTPAKPEKQVNSLIPLQLPFETMPELLVQNRSPCHTIPVTVPPDMERKTLVSIGVNTDVVGVKADPLAPVEQLAEIKPLLEKASDKFNSFSLITSLIENIPKVLGSKCPTDILASENSAVHEHGEDKTIVYLPKVRTEAKTASVEVQTNVSLIQQSKNIRYRHRNSLSCSSIGSNVSYSSTYSRRRNDSSSSSSSASPHSIRSSFSPRSTSSTSRSSSKFRRKDKNEERERLREVEERRVIYVGRLSPSITKEDLRDRFARFGPITNISIHTRNHGDNYGFVTYANKLDAYEAIAHGNDDPFYPNYDLSFGGRRIFCQTVYSDLDNVRDDPSYHPNSSNQDTFDKLLREAKEKLKNRNVV